MEIIVATLIGIVVGIVTSFITGPMAGLGVFLIMEFGVLFSIME